MMDNGGMLFGWASMWIFWLIVVMVLVFAIKAIMGSGSPTNELKQYSPLEILKKRYARGEIDEEEFNRRRKGLEE